MKLPWEKKHLCLAIILFLAIAAGIVFFMTLQNWAVVWQAVSAILNSLEPVAIGLIMAYLINPLMCFIEKKAVVPVFRGIFKNKYQNMGGAVRGVSILLAWVAVGAMIFGLMALVIPEVVKSIKMLGDKMPQYTSQLMAWVKSVCDDYPAISSFFEENIGGASVNLSKFINENLNLVTDGNSPVSLIASGAYSIIGTVVNVFVGVVVSIYVLKDKERFVSQTKKLVYSIFPLKRANGFISLMRLTHDKFGNFLIGKIYDSMIIGVMCFFILIIFNIPYAALVSLIVGVTNVIPFFGPFMGAIPSALLILCVDPIKSFTFVVLIFLLQQFDGSILGPKILGSTTGLSSFWVLTSILAGSSMLGMWGMLASVPLFAVAYALVGKFSRKSLKKKGIYYSGETFEKVDHIDEETKEPVLLSDK